MKGIGTEKVYIIECKNDNIFKRINKWKQAKQGLNNSIPPTAGF
jgi:hypothetical protein